MTVAGPRRLLTGLPFYALMGTEGIFYSVVRKKRFLPRFAVSVKVDRVLAATDRLQSVRDADVNQA